MHYLADCLCKSIWKSFFSFVFLSLSGDKFSLLRILSASYSWNKSKINFCALNILVWSVWSASSDRKNKYNHDS